MVSKSSDYAAIINSSEIDADYVSISGTLDVTGALILGFALDKIVTNYITPYTSPYLTISGGIYAGLYAGHANTLACDYAIINNAITVPSISVTSQLLLNNGTAALPSLAFTSDDTTGMYLPGIGTIGFATSGTTRMSLSSIGMGVIGDITVTGLVDGVDLSAFYTDYTSKINQALLTTSSPTFNTITLTSGSITIPTINTSILTATTRVNTDLVKGYSGSLVLQPFASATSSFTLSTILGTLTVPLTCGTSSITGGAFSCSSLVDSGTLSAAGITSTGAITAGTNSITGGAFSCSSLVDTGTLSATTITSSGGVVTDSVTGRTGPLVLAASAGAPTWTVSTSSLACSSSSSTLITNNIKAVTTGSDVTISDGSGFNYLRLSSFGPQLQYVTSLTQQMSIWPGVSASFNMPLVCGTYSLICGAISSGAIAAGGTINCGTYGLTCGPLSCTTITSTSAINAGTNGLTCGTISCGAITSTGAFTCGTNTLTSGAITSSGAFTCGTNSMTSGAHLVQGTLSCGTNSATTGALTCGAITSSGTISNGTNSMTCGSLSCGAVTSSGRMQIGATSPSWTHGQLEIVGTSSTTSATPSVNFLFTSDTQPCMQILPYSTNNHTINFDSYWAGTWISTNATSNYQIEKASNLLSLKYTGGIAVGGAIGWNSGLSLGSTGILTVGSSGVIRAPDGTAAAPVYSFTSETGTGFYRVGASDLGVSVGGTKVVDITSTTLNAGTLALTSGSHLAQGTLSCGTNSMTCGSLTSSSHSATGTISCGTNALTCGAVSCTTITSTSINAGTNSMTCGAISCSSVTSTGHVYCGGTNSGWTEGGITVNGTAGSSTTYPGINFVFGADTQPCMQTMAYLRDSYYINFDCASSAGHYVSFASSSNMQIAKTSSQIQFNYNTGVAIGGTFSSFSTAVAISTSSTTVSGLLRIADGSVSAPGLAFNSELGTGLYRIGASDLGVAISGTKQLEMTSTATTIVQKTTTPMIVLSNISSNDFYVEGTWTTVAGDSKNNFTSASQNCYYTRIGNMVYFNISYVWSSKGSATGNFQMTLPFTASGSRFFNASFAIGFQSGAAVAYNAISAMLHALSSNVIDFYAYTSGGVGSLLQCSAMSGTGQLCLGGSYSI